MILELLRRTPKTLLMLSHEFSENIEHQSCPSEMLDVKYTRYDTDRIIKFEPSVEQTSYHAYFLPWMYDTGFSLTLPSNPNGRNLFMTAELTGCCVGVQRIADGSVIVRHYNVDYESDLNMNDFQRYGETFWLLPKEFENRVDKNSNFYKHYYSGYCGNLNPTVFWGEYDNGWNFYYQTPDKVIHIFSPWEG